MKLNWNFLRGWGVQNKKPSIGGVWIFSGTAQSAIGILIQDHSDHGASKELTNPVTQSGFISSSDTP